MTYREIVLKFARYRRTLGAVAVLAAFVGLTSLAWQSLLDRREQSAAPSGWGQEALLELRQQAASLSPIADANACGMGASSCFKCHNGSRAAAPGMDPKKGSWHIDHKSVNGSCAGCHKGNARLVKKEMAHEGLIKDPRQNTADTCGGCHKSGNTADLGKRYQK